MDTLKSVLDKSFNIDFVSAVLSNPREKDGTVKVKIRPVMKQDRLLFQCEEYRNNQVFHLNLEAEATSEYVENQMKVFKQMQMETRQFRYQVLVSKKGKMTIQKRLQTAEVKEVNYSHNRAKHYILEEGKRFLFCGIWEL